MARPNSSPRPRSESSPAESVSAGEYSRGRRFGKGKPAGEFTNERPVFARKPTLFRHDHSPTKVSSGCRKPRAHRPIQPFLATQKMSLFVAFCRFCRGSHFRSLYATMASGKRGPDQRHVSKRGDGRPQLAISRGSVPPDTAPLCLWAGSALSIRAARTNRFRTKERAHQRSHRSRARNERGLRKVPKIADLPCACNLRAARAMRTGAIHPIPVIALACDDEPRGSKIAQR
jgi:hypothetical protein